MSEKNYAELREKSVVKANELIQQSRFSLSLQQQKIVLYLISQIDKNDEDFKLYEFDIVDFCKVCGIDYDNGGNYQLLKEQLKKISDKSIWVRLDNGLATVLRWIEKPYVDEGGGKIAIRLDRDMKPYLLQLKKNFTKYELIYTLHFKSKYTVRLYELIKSIHYRSFEIYIREYGLPELKRLLDAETYDKYQNFKQRVLLPSVNEINEYSDMLLEYQAITKGRKVVAIKFCMKMKDSVSIQQVKSEIDFDMGYDPNQISIYETFDMVKEQRAIEESKAYKKMKQAEEEARRILGETEAEPVERTTDEELYEQIKETCVGLHIREDQMKRILSTLNQVYDLSKPNQIEKALDVVKVVYSGIDTEKASPVTSFIIALKERCKVQHS